MSNGSASDSLTATNNSKLQFDDMQWEPNSLTEVSVRARDTDSESTSSERLIRERWVPPPCDA